MPGKVATIGDLHACPMCSGAVPHVGSPIIGPGAVGVLRKDKKSKNKKKTNSKDKRIRNVSK